MMDDRITQTACAIRMTCRRWLRSAAQANSSAVAVFDADANVLHSAVSQSTAIIVDANATAESIASAVEAGLSSHKHLPSVVVLKEVGTIAVAHTKPHADKILVSLRAGKALPGPESAPASAGRLTGCVAVVTGSAQGFGRGIAEELAGHGAMVTIADVNDPLGQACAKELCARFGEGCATYAHADVTSLASTQEMLRHTVCAFGGVDLFIANAGVLKAGSLEEMDERGFDLVTNVNYKAFFVGTKAVSAIMKQQHAFDKDHFMDIIQVNSKSGLQGSNKNFAYAGSKFGSIGLAQSFAMELVDFNIKVNVVCPGNFFEGPLWSDPEKGLFVQYLRAGKVPGAKTIEDVRQSYVSKVPMKRGCSPTDVTRAIVYLHEQLYETGQALPVTGGQVMLN
jgi:NAD(P)-dependent dehydrogenase (short-subunit alcohol dehydrogenase family)